MEAESEERLLDVLVEVGGVDGVEALGEGGQFLDEQRVAGALVVGARSELVVDAVDFCLDFMEMGERLARFVEDGALVLGFIWKEMSLNKVVPPNSTVGASTVIIIVRTGCIFVMGVESYIFLDKNC